MSERSERTDDIVSEPERPVLRVVRGEPTPEELAALVAVVLTRTEPQDHRRTAPGWADRGCPPRRPPRNGAGAWRTSLVR